MLKIIFGIFIILHGLVHMLYFGQSGRYFEMAPGMVWPDGAWAFSRLLGQAGTRNLASILLVLATLAFVVGGVGLFAKQAWWRPVVIGATGFSSVLYLLFWNGTFHALDKQGAVGILINLAILAAVIIFNWPKLDF
jgi:hypothetical protein